MKKPKLKPVNNFIQVEMLESNFAEKETKSGLVIQSGVSQRRGLWEGEVVAISDDIKDLDVTVGEIVYFKNFKPITIGNYESIENETVLIEAGNVLAKRKKTKQDKIYKE